MPFELLEAGLLLGHTLQVFLFFFEGGGTPAIGTCTSKFLGHVRSLDIPFNMLGTCTPLRHVLQNPRDKPALGTRTAECLGQALSWNRPFKISGTRPHLRHALHNPWDRPALGTCLVECLGWAHFWDWPCTILGTNPLLGHTLQTLWGQARFWDTPFIFFGFVGTLPL